MLSCAFEAFPSLSSETLESRQLLGSNPHQGRRNAEREAGGRSSSKPAEPGRNEGQRRPWGVGTGWNQETLRSGADSLWAFEHVS